MQECLLAEGFGTSYAKLILEMYLLAAAGKLAFELQPRATICPTLLHIWPSRTPLHFQVCHPLCSRLSFH